MTVPATRHRALQKVETHTHAWEQLTLCGNKYPPKWRKQCHIVFSLSHVRT